jgi:CRISPR-associated protein Csy1
VAKLTHSSSKGSSLLDISSEKNDQYLTTNNLSHLEVDTAYSDNKYAPIATVLKLSVDNVSVLDCLKQGDITFFTYLTDDNDLIQTWYDNLKQAYDSREKKSYFLNKQTYFPVGTNQYHLLLPLTSSSLVQAIHLEHQKYFDDEAAEARTQRSKGLYCQQEVRYYPNKAYLHVTGSNHSNASSLNGQRGGRIALFAAMPPQWDATPPSVINKESIFDAQLAYELRDEIMELQKYLLLLKNKALSVTEPKRNAAVMRKLQTIKEALFDYVESIKHNQYEPNWTMQSELKGIEQQLLFEPYRTDELAANAKMEGEWLKQLSQGYGRWLNKQLSTKQLHLTTIHEGFWSRDFFSSLREYIAISEVTA